MEAKHHRSRCTSSLSQLAVSKKSGTRPLFVLRDALLLLGDFRRGVGMNFELFLNAGRLS
jgi:hypothetical protein